MESFADSANKVLHSHCRPSRYKPYSKEPSDRSARTAPFLKYFRSRLNSPVYYPNCTSIVTGFYERIAQKNGLIATGGSDSHGDAKAYTYVGKKTVPLDAVEQLRQAKV